MKSSVKEGKRRKRKGGKTNETATRLSLYFSSRDATHATPRDLIDTATPHHHSYRPSPFLLRLINKRLIDYEEIFS